MSELVSGIIGGLIGFIASLLTIQFNYKKLFAETVSKNRMEWINNFREEIGIIISACKNNNDLPSDKLFEAEKARAKLLTRLNQDVSKAGNEYNKRFADLLSKIDFNVSATQQLIDELIKLTRNILEPEWQRVKIEAKGTK